MMNPLQYYTIHVGEFKGDDDGIDANNKRRVDSVLSKMSKSRGAIQNTLENITKIMTKNIMKNNMKIVTKY